MNLKICRSLSKYFLCGYLLFAICYLLTGCATVPMKEGGAGYIPLIPLCDSEGIHLEYDTFTRTAVLTKNNQSVNIMSGEKLVLVNGRPQYLRHPIEIYNGAVMVPHKFKEEVLSGFLKEPYPGQQIGLPVDIRRINKVVIDAGHGGKDPGAIGKTGVKEKNVNLDIARRLSRILESDGLKAVMTRNADTFVSLPNRVKIANNVKADIFVSIHSNANRVRRLKGFEVYYVSSNVSDLERALDAAQDTDLDLGPSCFASGSGDLKATLWDMIYTSNRAESIELANSICKVVNGNLEAKILGVKGARFQVLKGVRMPAVLIETGFLSNGKEERLLKNSYYRQKIAESIAEGIKKYDRELVLAEVNNQ